VIEAAYEDVTVAMAKQTTLAVPDRWVTA
jgi:hypothetical protein